MGAYRVAMLGWEFPPFVSGGLGTHCFELTKALAGRGVKIDFFMPKTRYDVKAPWVNVYQVDWELLADDKGGMVRIPLELGPYSSPLLSNATKSVQFLDKSHGASKAYDLNFFEAVNLYNYLAEQLILKLHPVQHYDIVHFHDWITARAGISIRQKTGIPLVTTVHSTEFDRTAGLWPFGWIEDIEREAVSKSDQVIVVSKRSRDQIISRLGAPQSKISVIYNAIDSSGFLKKKHSLQDAGREEKVVLYHGRLSVQKGVEFFLRAAQKVLALRRDVRFVVSGKGDLLPRLVELAIDLGIQDKVSFLGYVSDEQLRHVYATSDVFVLPSVSEPFGITALEAMASGTPVIVSKTSGVSELVKTCLVVDFWDVDQLSNKILSVLSYKALYEEMRENSLGEVGAITWDRVAGATVDVYSKAAECVQKGVYSVALGER